MDMYPTLNKLILCSRKLKDKFPPNNLEKFRLMKLKFRAAEARPPPTVAGQSLLLLSPEEAEILPCYLHIQSRKIF